MTLPIIVVWVPPRIPELTKSEATGTKVISTPANTPGSDSGTTTRRKALAPLDAGQRQNHEREVVVGEAADHGRGGGQDVEVLGEQAGLLERAEQDPLVVEDALPGGSPYHE